MIIFYCCGVILAGSAVLLRGRLARLIDIRLRRLWIVWAALLDQLVVISVLPQHDHAVMVAAHLASYAAAAAFAWSNRTIPGAVVVFAGGALNTLAIVANGGVMPASRTALAASGWRPAPGHFANSAVVPHSRLQFLGDIFNTPPWLPGHDVFSIGDVLIVVGFAVVIYLNCARPTRRVAATTTRSHRAAIAAGLAIAALGGLAVSLGVAGVVPLRAGAAGLVALQAAAFAAYLAGQGSLPLPHPVAVRTGGSGSTITQRVPL